MHNLCGLHDGVCVHKLRAGVISERFWFEFSSVLFLFCSLFLVLFLWADAAVNHCQSLLCLFPSPFTLPFCHFTSADLDVDTETCGCHGHFLFCTCVTAWSRPYTLQFLVIVPTVITSFLSFYLITILPAELIQMNLVKSAWRSFLSWINTELFSSNNGCVVLSPVNKPHSCFHSKMCSSYRNVAPVCLHWSNSSVKKFWTNMPWKCFSGDPILRPLFNQEDPLRFKMSFSRETWPRWQPITTYKNATNTTQLNNE